MGRFSKYNPSLSPDIEYLSDRAVIIQAWKKSHEYIRRHNWYSENLELDISCICLEKFCDDWCTVFTRPNRTSFRPTPMRIIPAPKPATKQDERWRVDTEGKLSSKDELGIRPLAHIPIKDQTMGMVFLMCLANIVENIQGMPVPYSKDIKNLTASYGNRLLCTWNYSKITEKVEAFFLWGNAETYNRYYSDYQAFITRPEKVYKLLGEELSHSSQYYVFCLDLSKCFDRISRDTLFQKVKRLVDPSTVSQRSFLECFKSFLKWSWDPRDFAIIEQYQCLLGDSINWKNGSDGIPQGLVISGFLANIYMLDFDETIKDFITSIENLPTQSQPFKIIDYCRYVDDMRFVLEVPESIAEKNTSEQIKIKFADFIQNILDSAAKGQKINKDKTYSYILNFSDELNLVEEEVQEIKYRASGPIDEANAIELLKLNKSIWLESEKSDDSFEKDTAALLKIPEKISTIKHESLERLAVYNWRKAYRILSLLLPAATSRDEKYYDLFNYPCSRAKLDLITEDFCTQILKRWINDPSKVRILRTAFDLFPHPRYLDIVLSLLMNLLRSNKVQEKQYAFYILSELFRAAAIETGFVYDKEQLPCKADIDKYREKLYDSISTILDAADALPWYLANQMVLFILVLNKPHPEANKLFKFADKIYCKCYNILTLKTRRINHDYTTLAIILLAYKISKRIEILHKYLPRFLNNPHQDEKEFLIFIYHTLYDIDLRSIAPRVTRRNRDIYEYFQHEEINKLQLKANQSIRLCDLLKLPNNPLKNEVSIIKFGLELCDYFKNQSITSDIYFSPANILISCSNWKNLSNPTKRSTIQISTTDDIFIEDKSYQPESWEDEIFARLTQVGKLMRAAMIGRIEYSTMLRTFGNANSLNNSDSDVHRYWGVRSSWLKRRYGLYFDRVATGGTHVPFSPWLNELLSSVLAWPGSWVDSKFQDISYSDFENLLKQRLNLLKSLYGKSSDTVIIPVEVDLHKFIQPQVCDTDSPNYDSLNVALVQTAYPSIDILKSDPLLSQVKHRKTAKTHLSDMLQMLLKTFKTHRALNPALSGINLILFPELSIHERDCFELEKFAEKMNCMVFCGKVYHAHPEKENSVINSGVWLIPQNKDDDKGRSFIRLLQGKKYLTEEEQKIDIPGMNIDSYRPVQWLIKAFTENDKKERTYQWTLSASICYDSTDICLSADLRDIVDCYIISAANKDINTFDSMVQSLRYHMFNHIVVINSGEYGGSTIQAPYEKPHERILLHNHGAMQGTVTIRTLNLADFKGKTEVSKKPPAGLRRWDSTSGQKI